MKNTLVLLVAATALGSFGGAPDEGSPGGPHGGLITLYVDDPLAHTFSFEDGKYGGIFEGRMMKSGGMDLDAEGYYPGEFTVGIEGGTAGQIFDLGSIEGLKSRYGYEETVGGGQGFASIGLEGSRFEILRSYALQTRQTLMEARILAKQPNHVPIADDHVYLIRLTGSDQYREQRYVKMMVVRYDPGEAVTIRWAPIG